MPLPSYPRKKRSRTTGKPTLGLRPRTTSTLLRFIASLASSCAQRVSSHAYAMLF
ncbi:hypothetical protein COCHEDRAFT_1023811, partial [Bipolaris maydis C5]